MSYYFSVCHMVGIKSHQHCNNHFHVVLMKNNHFSLHSSISQKHALLYVFLSVVPYSGCPLISLRRFHFTPRDNNIPESEVVFLACARIFLDAHDYNYAARENSSQQPVEYYLFPIAYWCKMSTVLVLWLDARK